MAETITLHHSLAEGDYNELQDGDEIRIVFRSDYRSLKVYKKGEIDSTQAIRSFTELIVLLAFLLGEVDLRIHCPGYHPSREPAQTPPRTDCPHAA